MAQIGNQNAAKGARWREAIERAINSWPESHAGGSNELMRGINAAAHAFVRKMMEDGDIAFFREFGDRLDGKPKQSMEVSGTDGEPLMKAVEVRLVRPDAKP